MSGSGSSTPSTTFWRIQRGSQRTALASWAGRSRRMLGDLGDGRPDKADLEPRVDIVAHRALEPDRAAAFGTGLDHGDVSSAPMERTGGEAARWGQVGVIPRQ